MAADQKLRYYEEKYGKVYKRNKFSVNPLRVATGQNNQVRRKIFFYIAQHSPSITTIQLLDQINGQFIIPEWFVRRVYVDQSQTLTDSMLKVNFNPFSFQVQIE